MVSEDAVLCPYCGRRHNKSVVMGTSGLINISGNESTVKCVGCDREFTCVKLVRIKFKTMKIPLR